MKVFHVKKANVSLRKEKPEQGGQYLGMERYWGHLVIYEEESRCDDHFATLFDPAGTRRHEITRQMFKHLMLLKPEQHFIHVYERGFSTQEVLDAAVLLEKAHPCDLEYIKRLLLLREEQIRN